MHGDLAARKNEQLHEVEIERLVLRLNVSEDSVTSFI